MVGGEKGEGWGSHVRKGRKIYARYKAGIGLRQHQCVDHDHEGCACHILPKLGWLLWSLVRQVAREKAASIHF